jgi:DNA-binding response OmpR family regulator
MAILFPQAPDLVPAPGVVPQQTPKQQAVERTTRVLLVEDEPLTAEVFALALSRDGHEVEVARDGLQALRRLEKRLPTVLVLDLNLPAVSGADVVRRLRGEGHHRLPIVIVSGRSRDNGMLPPEQLEPGVWLAKPIKPRDLVQVVRRFVHDATR